MRCGHGLRLAQDVEALGYHRFWVSEHHGLPTIVGSAPEMLLAAIAARTSRIRIGSAGVMLPHYSALKVAEQFGVLDALAPGRIDLGVGRAPGGDMRTAFALNPNAAHAAEAVPAAGAGPDPGPAASATRGIAAHPAAAGRRAPRSLDAGQLGLRRAPRGPAGAALRLRLLLHADGRGVEQALDLYRTLYQPERPPPAAAPTICVWALAADTQPRKRASTRQSRERWRLDRQRCLLGPLQPLTSGRTRIHRRRTGGLAPVRRTRWSAPARRVAARMRALAARAGTGRDRREHLGARPGGAAAVLCAHRRRILGPRKARTPRLDGRRGGRVTEPPMGLRR